MEDPNGIFTLWLDFGDTFFIMNFKYFNYFFSWADVSNLETLHCCFSHFQKDLEENSWWFGTQFPLIFFITGGSLRSKKVVKKNQLSSSLCCSESFLLLSKLNFQISPEYSASDSTYETLCLILLWIDQCLHHGTSCNSHLIFLPTASSNCVPLMFFFQGVRRAESGPFQLQDEGQSVPSHFYSRGTFSRVFQATDCCVSVSPQFSCSFKCLQNKDMMLRKELIPTANVEDCLCSCQKCSGFILFKRTTKENIQQHVKASNSWTVFATTAKSLKHSLSVCYVFYQSQIS